MTPQYRRTDIVTGLPRHLTDAELERVKFRRQYRLQLACTIVVIAACIVAYVMYGFLVKLGAL